MIASCLAANLRILRTFPGLSSLSPSLYPHWAISRVTVNKNNFLDGLDVMSILLNFLLISQTYSLCDRDLFRYIPLVVTPCNTEKFGALRIHMFLNHPIFSVCFFPSSKSSFSTYAICIAILFILGAISDTVGDDYIMFGSKFENFTDISWVEFIVPFSVSSLSDILSYCRQEYFMVLMYCKIILRE